MVYSTAAWRAVLKDGLRVDAMAVPWAEKMVAMRVVKMADERVSSKAGLKVVTKAATMAATLAAR